MIFFKDEISPNEGDKVKTANERFECPYRNRNNKKNKLVLDLKMEIQPNINKGNGKEKVRV